MTATFPVIDISGFAQGMSLCGPELQRRFRLPSKKAVFCHSRHDVSPQTIATQRELAWRLFDLPLEI
jgi:hypothetical protein